MKHRPIVPLLFLVILVVTSVASASSPTIEGQVSGIELCPQSVCNSAIFAGVFEGTVGGKPAKGSFSVSVEHTDLPTTTGGTASITDGSWFMKTRKNVFYGDVPSGTITKNEDNTFAVTAELDVDFGGSGSVAFSGLLNHNVFPPTIIGMLSGN